MPELFIGLMSGTSVDAVDGALVDLAARRPQTLAFASRPIPAILRERLLQLQQPGGDELAIAAEATVALTDLYAAVVAELIEQPRHGCQPGFDAAEIQAIGAHGQTVRHRPELGYTLQLIDGARLAERCGLPVVCDFRSADVAAGGQGAPLVPAFHADAFADPVKRRVIVNLGGIANVSLLAPGEPIRGFDTGPANLLLDFWCEAHTGQPFDRDGAWGATGQVDPGLLARLLADPYFDRPAPKSTGRDLFHGPWLLERLGEATLPANDVQATLAELTAVTVASACRQFGAEEIYVCGGGARNAALMRRLAAASAPARVDSTQALGADPQAVEAVAFAWLAACRLRGLPGNLPEVTGARGPRVLGALYPASPSR